MPSPYTAKLDDYLLNILDISDNIGPSVAQHDFIGTDGAVFENMGNRPRTIRFKTYFFGNPFRSSGPPYKPTYENHRKFLDDMTNSTKEHTLIHPKYGTIKGLVTNLAILHNDTQRYVEIDIDFTEQGIKVRGAHKNDFDVDAKTQAQYVKQINNQLAAAGNSIQQSGFGSIVGQVVDKAQPFVNQLKNLSSKARAYVKEIDRVVGKINTFASSITQPISSLEASINYVDDVPSGVIQAVQRCSERVMALTSLTSTSPVRMMRSSNQAADDLVASLTGGTGNTASAGNQYTTYWQNVVKAHMAGRTAYQLGVLYKQDQDQRNLQQKIEKVQAFDVSGNRVLNTQSPDTMSRQDVEDALASARLQIQNAINADRDNQADLKTLANTLVTYVDQIKLSSLLMVSMTVNQQPMHSICATLGLSYEAADRLLRINSQIQNPTFTSGNINVYAA